MKNLLGLLGTIIIAGSGMTGIVGNAPPPVKKEINYLQTNSLETLKRTKREDISNKILSITQLNKFWCGPAIAESILRSFGLNPIVLNVNNARSYQSILAEEMHTIPERQEQEVNDGGTSVVNWVNVVNNYINRYNLNSRRNYSVREINSNTHTRIELSRSFYRLVESSLRNNTPVAIAYSGLSPTSFNTHFVHNINNPENTISEQHFIIVNGITDTNNRYDFWSDSFYYRYMDPFTGTFGTIRNYDLLSLFENQGNVILYQENQNLQEEELMDIGNCVLPREIEINNNCFSGRSIRSLKNEACFYNINYENTNGSYIEVWYTFLGHNQIKIEFSASLIKEIFKSFILPEL